jgi:Arc/MetJ-type ribon-helix-helix transcriptional regulator
MTFQLPENLERSLLRAVHSGEFASLDDAMAAAARLLLEKLQQGQAGAKTPAVSEEAFLKQLVDLGLMSQLPDTQADVDDPDDQPITIEGEPLSETIIRERR